jgi:hypothetical protein
VNILSASGPNLHCAATDESPCEPAAGAIVRPPRKLESLLDRLDAIVFGSLFALLAYFSTLHWDFSKTFHHDEAPLLLTHTWSFPVVSLVLYLLMVHVLGPFLRRNPADQSVAFGISEKFIKEALRFWNLALALLSICMLFGMGIPLIVFLYENGLYQSLCDTHHRRWSGPAWFWMYLFAMSKYAELFDTAFLVLRRKPVSFLHWYHHTSVLAYTWFAVVVGFCPGWMFAIINSGVHTIMYWYYARAASGVRLTYDKLVTTIQLSQMVIGFAVTSTWAILHYVSDNGVTECPCNHAEWAMLSALLIYGSYFALFLSFYLKRYSASKTIAGKLRIIDAGHDDQTNDMNKHGVIHRMIAGRHSPFWRSSFVGFVVVLTFKEQGQSVLCFSVRDAERTNSKLLIYCC